jgi:type I restriction enzyme S subunit
LAGEWREISVEELAADVENALATGPFGSSISSRHFVSTGIPVIRGTNLSDDIGTRLDDTTLVFLTPAKAREFARSTVRIGDLVFTCWGTVGQVGLLDGRAAYDQYVISNKQMKLTPDPEKADSLFLYYLFSSPLVRQRILSEAIGSSVPGFNLGQLRAIRVSIPGPDEQRAIARVLGALDDKIELNRLMSQTLEAIARALFKSWFVDFEPVKCGTAARSKGNADIFPSKLEPSDLGPVPQGWLVTRWGGQVSLEYGKALSGYDEGTGRFPVYGTNGRIGSHSEALCPHAGIIVGRKGAYRGVHYSNSPFFVIDTAFFVKPRVPIMLRWAYYELLRLDINSMDSGSAIPSTSRDEFYNLPVVVPPFAIQQAFVRTLEPIWARQEQAERESQCLRTIRDALLPKLITGEIRIKDAERIAARYA